MSNVIAPPADLFNKAIKLLSVAKTEVQRFTNSHPPEKQSAEMMAAVCAAQLVSKEAKRALKIATRRGSEHIFVNNFFNLAQRACLQALYVINLAGDTDCADYILAVMKEPLIGSL